MYRHTLLLFFIEITSDKLYAFGAGVIAILLTLGLLAVAKKNIRDEFLKPLYGLLLQPFLTRRKKISEVLDKVEIINLRTETIEHELKTNGGSSVKDAVLRIEKHQDYFSAKFRHGDHIAKEALFEFDENGNCTFVNRAMCLLLNVESTELLNRAWINRIEHSMRERVKLEWKDAIENKISLDSRINFIDGSDGEVFQVRLHAQPNIDRNGNLKGFFGHVEIVK
jgi:PAS domain S-box-containing protein